MTIASTSITLIRRQNPHRRIGFQPPRRVAPWRSRFNAATASDRTRRPSNWRAKPSSASNAARPSRSPRRQPPRHPTWMCMGCPRSTTVSEVSLWPPMCCPLAVPLRGRSKIARNRMSKNLPPRSRKRNPRTRPESSVESEGRSAFLCSWRIRVYFRYDRNQARQARQNNQAAATALPQALRTLPSNGAVGQSVGPWTMPTFAQPPPPAQIEPGVMFSEVRIQRAQGAGPAQPGHGGKLWLYLPSGQHGRQSLPCILIAAPART